MNTYLHQYESQGEVDWNSWSQLMEFIGIANGKKVYPDDCERHKELCAFVADTPRLFDVDSDAFPLCFQNVLMLEKDRTIRGEADLIFIAPGEKIILVECKTLTSSAQSAKYAARSQARRQLRKCHDFLTSRFHIRCEGRVIVYDSVHHPNSLWWSAYDIKRDESWDRPTVPYQKQQRRIGK